VLPVTANALAAVITVRRLAVFSIQFIGFSLTGRQMFREGIFEFCNEKYT